MVRSVPFHCLAACLAATMFMTTDACTHGVEKSVSRGEAVVIELTHDDGEAFSFERYEIYREGEGDPYQVGSTDVNGRIVFIPDREGAWRVRAFSQDGHGVDFTFENEAPGEAHEEEIVAPVSTLDRVLRVIVGVLIIFALCRAIVYFRERKRTTGS